MPAINLQREDVFITNTVFWRPPGNRRPTPQEIKTCRPFVEKIISIVKPKLIILVGSTAVESMLDKKVPMSELRNKTFSYNNEYLDKPINTAVIFHPSYLLRQSFKKKDMWFDLINIKQKLINASS